MTTLVRPAKKGFRRVQLATGKQHIVHVRGKDVIVAEKRMLLDEGHNGLAIFGPQLVLKQGTRLQQGTASFEGLIHRIVAMRMAGTGLVVSPKLPVEVQRIQGLRFRLSSLSVKRIMREVGKL